jgi:cyclophilin family peptidyl-prolyl cis-trans isomerase
MYYEIFGILLFIIFIIIIKYKLNDKNKIKLDNKDKIKLKNKDKIKLNNKDKIKLDKKDKIKLNNKDKIKLNNKDKIKLDNKDKIKLKNKDNSDKVFLEIKENKKILGKIIIKLFNNITPKTCKNFNELCKSKKYINTPFHRIIKNFMIQGGDFTNKDGTGGFSIYGNTFCDENFKLKHNKKYLLSMANSGPNTNGSQFFITTSICSHLDNKHVVFGKVIDGFDIIDYLNNVKTNSDDSPKNNIIISDCGNIV